VNGTTLETHNCMQQSSNAFVTTTCIFQPACFETCGLPHNVPPNLRAFSPSSSSSSGAWTRIHGGLGDAASRLSSWPAQGDAAILDATPTVSLESSRNVVNWTRNGRSRDARNRTSQSGDPGEKTPGGAGTHRHTGHTRLSNLTTNPSTHQHAHARPRHDPGDDRTTRPTQSR
jgi:hypothetical protein